MASLMTSNAIHFGFRTNRKVSSLTFDGVPSPLAAVLRMLTAWEQRIRARDALAEMDRRTLADIGISRPDTFAEVEKPFWHA